MENKIKFRKELVKIGTSFGFVVTKHELNLLGLDFDELKKSKAGIMLDGTLEIKNEEIQKILNYRTKENIFAEVAADKMNENNLDEFLIKKETEDTKDENKDETKVEKTE